jgi:hypothetical protein
MEAPPLLWQQEDADTGQDAISPMAGQLPTTATIGVGGGQAAPEEDPVLEAYTSHNLATKAGIYETARQRALELEATKRSKASAAVANRYLDQGDAATYIPEALAKRVRSGQTGDLIVICTQWITAHSRLKWGMRLIVVLGPRTATHHWRPGPFALVAHPTNFLRAPAGGPQPEPKGAGRY